MSSTHNDSRCLTSEGLVSADLQLSQKSRTGLVLFNTLTRLCLRARLGGAARVSPSSEEQLKEEVLVSVEGAGFCAAWTVEEGLQTRVGDKGSGSGLTKMAQVVTSFPDA